MTTDVIGVQHAGTVATRRHFASLDGYRGIAALLVILCHVALISGLNGRTASTFGPYLARADVGVAIFFVLSGFLIYRPFAAAQIAGAKTMGWRAFYRRRALRILPAYWVALTVVAYVLHAPAFTGSHRPIWHYLLLHVYSTNQVIGGPVQQSWSLATEISFYAFVPIYAWAIRRGRVHRSPQRQIGYELGGAAALILGSIGLKLIAVVIHLSPARFGQLGTWLPFRLDSFGIGMFLAIVSTWSERPHGPALKVTSWRFFPAVAWAGAAFVFWATSTQFGFPLGPILTTRQAALMSVLYPATAVLALLPGLFGPDHQGLFRRIMQTRVMVFLGLISYGLYIWHEAWLSPNLWFRWTGYRQLDAPFWQLLVGTLALTIPVAAASYYLVELPALKFKNRRVRALPAAAPDPVP